MVGKGDMTRSPNWDAGSIRMNDTADGRKMGMMQAVNNQRTDRSCEAK